jgi:putative phage-type endonuclease
MIEQGSPEWFAARCGKVTASKIADMMARTKAGAWGAGRANYMAQIISEILTGTVAESFSNAAMQWGVNTEPQARAAYEFVTDFTVEKVDFIVHPRIARSGASPDGMVDPDGLVEIKCPNTATHIDTLIDKAVPSNYILQMQWQMACTGRKWADFVSFDPRMPDNMQLFIKRIERDTKTIATLEVEVQEFLVEIDAKVSKLTELYGVREAA